MLLTACYLPLATCCLLLTSHYLLRTACYSLLSGDGDGDGGGGGEGSDSDLPLATYCSLLATDYMPVEEERTAVRFRW